jgi:DinB superfamily
MGIDVGADPSFDEVVLVREERMDIVRELVAGVTDEDLARTRGEHTMLRCLCTLFDEEWHHNWFANRDLDVLTAG